MTSPEQSNSDLHDYEVEMTLHEQGTAIVRARSAQEAAEKIRRLEWDGFDVSGTVRAGVRSVRRSWS